MSSYAAMDRHFPTTLTAHLGPVNAEAIMVAEGGESGDVSLGRYSTIIKPVSIPTSAPISHQPFTYIVASGENLKTTATKYHVSVAETRWSNPTLYSSDSVPTGDQIVIPPVHGVVVTTKASDTVGALATKYSVDPQVIVDFNRLRTTTLTPGMTLVVPGGKGGGVPPPPAPWQILGRENTGPPPLPGKGGGCRLGPYVNYKFPVGG